MIDMIGILCTLLTFTAQSNFDNTEIDMIINKLDQKVHLEIEGKKTTLHKLEAKATLTNWFASLRHPQVMRSHPAKFNSNRDTYGLYHLKSSHGDYRFFYFSEMKDNTHKIVRIKIIKV